MDSILTAGEKFDTPKPVATADRLLTIDMIRGVALLGILMMNIPGFGIHFSAYYSIFHGSPKNADYITLEIVEVFFAGTMRGLFSMLFGAGMILFTMNKKESPVGVTVTEYYYRRLLWLVIFGLFNGYILLWTGDILYFYGLCGMILYPFRKLDPKWLLAIGLLCMSIYIGKSYFWYKEQREVRIEYNKARVAEKAKKKLTDEQKSALTNWESMANRRKPDTANQNPYIRTMHSNYADVFTQLVPQNADSESWGMYHGLWDMLLMMFIGMALFGWGFFSGQLSSSTYWMTLLLGYGFGIPISYLLFKNWGLTYTDLGAYLDRYRVSHELLYDIRRILLSIGHASLLLLIYRSKLVPWFVRGLANVGQMAFTNYLMQSIICTIYFNGYGFSHYNDLRYYQMYYLVISVWIFQIIFSAIWLRFFRFGPFEWVWRSLTYWKLQPMRK